MAALGDSLDPIDEVLTRLSIGPTSDQLPLKMQCPAGHEVHRELWDRVDWPKMEKRITIPFYVCVPCTVMYRYQECTLIPGDEGIS